MMPLTEDPQQTNPAAPSQLNRSLGLSTSILLVAGLMIGSGAFKKIAPMSQQLNSETYILLAWICAGAITMIGAFTYAGLATVTTKTGGIYEYLRLAFGDFISFLFGWSFFTIAGSGAIAALAFIFSQSVNTLIEFPNPFAAYQHISIGNFIYPFADSGVKIFAMLVIVILTWLNCLGLKPGALLNNVVTLAKISGILLLMFAGFFYIKPANSEAIHSAAVSTISNNATVSSFLAAMLSALWAYDGWAQITFITGEIKNPQRKLPFAILGGVTIATLLYVLLNYSFMQVLTPAQFADTTQSQIAGVTVAGVIMKQTGTILISILIMTCTFGAANACIMVYPRLYYRMAQEKRFFLKAATIHPSYRTPHIALIWSGAWSCILIITGTFDFLTNLVVFSSYFFFGLTGWALIKMKRKKLITAKVVGYPVTPILFILFSLALIVNTFITETKQSLIGLLLVLSGFPFYWYFKRVERNETN
ncbi:MAG: amino acid permease [Bacteroidota bacterium]